METINTQLFLRINGLAGNGFFDSLNCIIAKGSPYICLAILVAVYLLGKKDRALYAFYASMLGLLINTLTGIFYFHPRPFMLGLGHALIAHSPETSFPSDHATLAFSLAFSFLFAKDMRLGVGLFFFAMLVGFSRTYTGLHFPADIVGSLLVGIAAAGVVAKAEIWLKPLNSLLNRFYYKLLGVIAKRTGYKHDGKTD